MNLKIRNVLKVLLALSCHYISFTAAFNKYNISLEELSSCREYQLNGGGYRYKDFFQVHVLENNKANADKRLHLKFYVMTSMDAHILLSVTNHPRSADRVYEIVIGAGTNTFSAIRKYMGRNLAATNQERGLLSPYDPTPIEITQMKNGSLFVFIPGHKAGPLLNFTDASPLTINYISFSTFDVVHAKWFFDCKFDGFDNEIEQEVRVLTPRQRLIANITTKAENRTMPLALENINFAFQIRSVAYKQDTALLQTRLNLQLYWEDPRLKWNPKDFKGIEALVESDFDIWTPTIVVLNGALKTIGHFKPTHELHIWANGSISLHASNAALTSWCRDEAQNWPHEHLRCRLVIGLNDAHEATDAPLQLRYDLSKPLSPEPINTLSEWQFVEVSVTNIVSDNSTTTTPERTNELGILRAMEGDISMEFAITRNTSFYKNVFTIPFLAAQTLITLSFLLRGYRRGALILVAFILISMGMMFITRHAPPFYVPNLMLAYQHIMHIVTACYLLHIVLIWLRMYPPKSKPPACLLYLINLSPLRLLLCMRIADSSEYIAILEHPWNEVAKICNNLSFIIIHIVLIAIDSCLLTDV